VPVCANPERARLLHRGVHAEGGGEDTEEHVGCGDELIERARLPREEAVHQPRERGRERVRPRHRPDEDPLPDIRVGVFLVLEAGLRSRVGKVDEEDETDEVAPRGVIQSPQKVKKLLGMNQETRMRSSHTTTFGPHQLRRSVCRTDRAISILDGSTFSLRVLYADGECVED